MPPARARPWSRWRSGRGVERASGEYTANVTRRVLIVSMLSALAAASGGCGGRPEVEPEGLRTETPVAPSSPTDSTSLAREHQNDSPGRAVGGAHPQTAPSAAVPPGAPAAVVERTGGIVVAAVGDLMLGNTYPRPRLAPDDGARLLRAATPVLQSADFAFGNLEAPLFDSGEPHCTPDAIEERHPGGGGTRCWSFRMPARYADRLEAAGLDVLSLANNHIDDFGPEGRASTLRELDRRGLRHSGPVGTVARLAVGSLSVELIAFSTDAGLNDMDDHDAVRALIGGATADIVIVSFHGGAEGPSAMHVPHGPETFHGARRGDVRAFARVAIDAGADLVLGHGPHVVRGLELYRGRLIAYSLGSFATYAGIGIAGPRGRTMVLEARLRADGSFRGGRVHPMRQRRPQGTVEDSPGWLVETLRRLSREDFGEHAVRIGEDGELFVPDGAPDSDG